ERSTQVLGYSGPDGLDERLHVGVVDGRRRSNARHGEGPLEQDILQLCGYVEALAHIRRSGLPVVLAQHGRDSDPARRPPVARSTPATSTARSTPSPRA